MYNPHDRFGQMMVKNFAIRGCPLIGINKYPLLENQRLRYESANFQETEVFTMQQMYIWDYKAIMIVLISMKE
jgi:hypothetical protein